MVKYDKIQMGDVRSTVASNNILKKYINMKKPTNHKIGIKKFVDWYLKYSLSLKK